LSIKASRPGPSKATELLAKPKLDIHLFGYTLPERLKELRDAIALKSKFDISRSNMTRIDLGYMVKSIGKIIAQNHGYDFTCSPGSSLPLKVGIIPVLCFQW